MATVARRWRIRTRLGRAGDGRGGRVRGGAGRSVVVGAIVCFGVKVWVRKSAGLVVVRTWGLVIPGRDDDPAEVVSPKVDRLGHLRSATVIEGRSHLSSLRSTIRPQPKSTMPSDLLSDSLAGRCLFAIPKKGQLMRHLVPPSFAGWAASGQVRLTHERCADGVDWVDRGCRTSV